MMSRPSEEIISLCSSLLKPAVSPRQSKKMPCWTRDYDWCLFLCAQWLLSMRRLWFSRVPVEHWATTDVCECLSRPQYLYGGSWKSWGRSWHAICNAKYKLCMWLEGLHEQALLLSDYSQSTTGCQLAVESARSSDGDRESAVEMRERQSAGGHRVAALSPHAMEI